MNNGQKESDDLLIQLISEKDESAFSLFYDQKSRFVYSLAFNIVKNKNDAEELTEEIFLKIWNNAKSYNKNRGSVMAWLTIIARRHSIDRIRSKQYKKSGKEVSINAVDPSLLNSNDHEEQFLISSDVTKALNQLDSTYRDLIKLSYYEGMSHSMIASETNTPLGTVKTRIREAIKQLRELLIVEV